MRSLLIKRRLRPGAATRVRKRWRAAANIVTARWETFLEAESDAREFAFASYVAALDAEEAAATELAGIASQSAA